MEMNYKISYWQEMINLFEIYSLVCLMNKMEDSLFFKKFNSIQDENRKYFVDFQKINDKKKF